MEKQPRQKAQQIRRSPMPGPNQAAIALTPKDVVSIIRRHLWLIIILSIMGLIGGGVTWYLMLKYIPKYTAETYIRVLPPIEKDPMVIGGGTVAKDLQYGYRLSIALQIKQQSMLMNLLKRDKIKETEWYKSFGSEQNIGKRIKDAIENLENNLGVYAARDAEFVTVSMTCGTAKESAGIVNEMVDLFIASQKSTKVSGIRGKLVELEARRVSIQRELDLAQKGLNDVRKNTGFTDLEERQFEHTITLRLNSLDEEAETLAIEFLELQAQIDRLEKIAKGPINEQVENAIERDPTMVMLTQQLFAAKTGLAQLQTKFGEGHRDVLTLKKRIEALQERRNARKVEIGEQTRQANLKNAKDILVVAKTRLEQTILRKQKAESEKVRLDQARVLYEQQTKIRDQLRDTLNDIKELIEKRRIEAEDPETKKVIKVGDAPTPLEVSSPIWFVYFFAGTFLGFVCAIGLAFLLELLNDLLRTPRDVIKYVNAPLLGVVPHASEDRQARDMDLRHIVRLAPYSIVSEAYRQLRINLRLYQGNKDAKIIFVSSCGPADGKTTVAVNLATTLALEGQKTLLIDANFWWPMLHKAFPKTGLDTAHDEKAKSQFGLSNLLLGETTNEQVIRPSGIEMLDVIDAGPTVGNPTKLLSSEKMIQLVEQQKSLYNHIIIDGPPILLVSGAKVLAASIADGSIIVLNADLTRRGAAQRAIREMKDIDANIVGCVLLAVRSLKGGYYKQYYKSFQQYQEPAMAS